MLQINRILCPTDFSESAERAFGHAAFLADWHAADLHLLNVAPDTENGEPLFEDEELEAEIEDALGGRKDAVHPLLNRITQLRRDGSSARDAIVDYVEEADVDLVVLGTEGKRGLERILLGSTAEGVVRLAPCPVLTVRKDARSSPQKAVERILAPVDFSDFTDVAISHAVELAQTYGARIDLVHVVPDAVPVSPYAYPDMSQQREWEKEAEKQLAKLAEEKIGFEHVLVTVLTGHPAYEILNYAEEHDTDLIVIPTHGHSGVERLLLGSIAEKVVRQSPVPVFTLKSFGRSLVKSASN